MIPRLSRIKSDLKTGWALVRKGSAEAVDRSLEEVELLRLRRQLYAVEDQIKDLFRAAGERAFQLIERGSESVMNDKELTRLFEKVDQLKQEEARIRFEMDQVKE
jgi:5'-deoxynucleotidase YfbR-like HD superfamily hydrolase